MLPDFNPDLSPEDRQRIIDGLRKCIEAYPELRDYVIEKTWKQGWLDHLGRLFGRRLKRSLTETERQTLEARFEALGADRLVDVVLVLNFTVGDVAGWLAGPNAC